MRRAAILIICFFLLLIPLATSAQTVAIDTMLIDIWPEYDRPEVLVIYHFTLTESTTLPVQMTLRIPASSGGPYNLAYVNINDGGKTGLYNLEYTSQQRGDWLEISFSAPTSSIQMEYYDPGMLRDGDSREFMFTWPADYMVQSMAIQILQPINAVDMQIVPDLGTGQTFQDGRTYYSAHFGQMGAGEQFNMQLRYNKPDDILSEGYDQVFAAEDGGAARQTTFENALPWVLGGVGILLITVAVVWYLVPNQEVPFPRKRHPLGDHEKQPENAQLYCHNCGTLSKPDDLYCRSCGTKLRK